MSDQSDIHAKTRTSGQLIFVVAALAASLLLLSQIRTQTAWIDGTVTPAQPRFWPAIALTIMVAGLGLHLWLMRRRRPNRADWEEARRWLQPVEYLVWFMVFVFAVPQIGFLPMSLVFCCALTWRLGYRDTRALILAGLFAVAVVVVFKAWLGVKIPGAALYEFLPSSIRSFFLQYL